MRRIIVLSLVLCILTSGIGGVVSADSHQVETMDSDTDRLIVQLDENGGAEVSLQIRFDLSDDTMQDVFNDYENDDAALEEERDSFENSMRGVADSMSENRENDVTVENVHVETVRNDDNDIGAIVFHSTWTNFAEQNNGIVVNEPFSSGFFNDDVDVTIIGPENWYGDSTPQPTERTDNVLTWKYGDIANSDSFEVVFIEQDDVDDSTNLPVLPLVGLLGITTLVIFVVAQRVYSSD